MTTRKAAEALLARILAEKGDDIYIDESKLNAAVDNAGFYLADVWLDNIDDQETTAELMVFCPHTAPSELPGTYGVQVKRLRSSYADKYRHTESTTPIVRLAEVTKVEWLDAEEASD